eukprot:Sdes_comp19706_c0_seq1m11633
MVLLAASICTKTGKPLVSRQFIEMSRSRIEGLLSAFPKLVGSEQEHTFIETESVRYVYQPIEQLYVVLITTNNSNILEDLETLHLFARVIPEYCRILTENEVCDNAFDLIFAFDEIIALGYRESVNITQVKTFTEMDSHDEKVFQLVQKNKEREAKEEAKRKMKELEQQRRDLKTNVSRGFSSTGGFGSNQFNSGAAGNFSSSNTNSSFSNLSTLNTNPAPREPPTLSRGMKLGGKTKANDFIDALGAEASSLPDVSSLSVSRSVKTSEVDLRREAIHIRIEEKISMNALRDGGLESLEVKGDLYVLITEPEKSKIRIALRISDDKGFQFKTHPNIDKRLFTQDSVIGLKDASRSIPVHSEQGVLKWRLQTTDESLIPLTINCWPSVNPDKSCDVNIEYELEQDRLSLTNLLVLIPLPSGSAAPVVGEIEGEFVYTPRQSRLEWHVPLVDCEHCTGAMEFTVPNCADVNAFFPLSVSFGCKQTFCELQVVAVEPTEGEGNFSFSLEQSLTPENYGVV